MGYQSRKRNYTSRRERLEQHGRKFRVIGLFVLIALLVILFMNRREIYYFYESLAY